MLTAVMYLFFNTADSFAGRYKIFTRSDGGSAGCKDADGNHADCSNCNLGYDKRYYGETMKYNSQLASQTGKLYHCSSEGAINGRIVINSVKDIPPIKKPIKELNSNSSGNRGLALPKQNY